MSTGPSEAQNFRELLLAVESALQAPDAADLAELQENLLRALPSFQRLLEFPASPRSAIGSAPPSTLLALHPLPGPQPHVSPAAPRDTAACPLLLLTQTGQLPRRLPADLRSAALSLCRLAAQAGGTARRVLTRRPARPWSPRTRTCRLSAGTCGWTTIRTSKRCAAAVQLPALSAYWDTLRNGALVIRTRTDDNPAYQRWHDPRTGVGPRLSVAGAGCTAVAHRHWFADAGTPGWYAQYVSHRQGQRVMMSCSVRRCC